jgi:hypothetical protein
VAAILSQPGQCSRGQTDGDVYPRRAMEYREMWRAEVRLAQGSTCEFSGCFPLHVQVAQDKHRKLVARLHSRQGQKLVGNGTRSRCGLYIYHTVAVPSSHRSRPWRPCLTPFSHILNFRTALPVHFSNEPFALKLGDMHMGCSATLHQSISIKVISSDQAKSQYTCQWNREFQIIKGILVTLSHLLRHSTIRHVRTQRPLIPPSGLVQCH